MKKEFLDRVVNLVEGNPGAVSALAKLGEVTDLDPILLRLEQQGIRGPRIWVLYKDRCGFNLQQFAEAILTREDLREITEY